ncbi:MAG: polyprenyl synthetase family protein [Bdellovibrionales bacterium]|nr:polyprenyl synthetase family protein [Bdellovibrionales bacterium]
MQFVSEADYSRILNAYRADFPLGASLEPALRACLVDLLGNPGSLVRAQLALRSGESGEGIELRSCSVGIAVEYFHLASLLLDDLPSMDNAALRRKMPCVHLTYGEATATLASLALLNRAYAMLYEAIEDLPGAARAEARKLIEECLGVGGIVGGQAWDLALTGSGAGPQDYIKVALGKTASLFQLVLVLPALLTGASRRELHQLRRFALLSGLLYQIVDDLKDLYATPQQSGKTARDLELERPNLLLQLSATDAMSRFERFQRIALKIVAALEQRNSRWSFLGELTGEMRRRAAALVERVNTLEAAA